MELRDLRIAVTGQGGWRGSPNSLASLARYRVHFPDQPKCSRCRRIALRGTTLCSSHSGRKPAPRTPGRRAGAVLAGLERAGLLPGELIAMPVWRGLSNVMGEERTLTRLALVLAWDKRAAEPLAWATTWRDAVRLVRETPPRQSPLPSFMNNQ